MFVYAAAVLSGAFLLFLVQPMLGKFLLPSFGGGAAVWTACLVFFQAGLFGGYLYAYLLGRLSLRAQVGVHGLILGAAVFAFGSPERVMEFELDPAASPFWGIQQVLASGIGLPYLALGATAPLVQRWLERALPEAPAYRLYALSNLGSFGALLSYPTWIEPVFTRGDQAAFFQLGLYGLFGLVIACGVRTWKAGDHAVSEPESSDDARSSVPSGRGDPSGTGDRLAWWGLAAVSAALLVAVTQAISENVPPMPFLWVLFLGLYLISYTLAFQGATWVQGRGVKLVLFVGGVLVMRTHYLGSGERGYLITLLEYGVFFFAAVCYLHGELYRRRPRRSGDSSFYLGLAGGGVLGGLAVALLAPALATTWIELPLLVLVILELLPLRPGLLGSPPRRAVAALVVGVGLLLFMIVQEKGLRASTVIRGRNAYGVHAVYELGVGDPIQHRYELTSGTTAHGWQYQAPEYRREPTAYFTRQSGVGRAFRSFPTDRPLNVGIVGLGAGVLATYGNAGDRMRFYEIDPKVIHVAEETFTFLEDSRAEIEIVPGDARVALEGEADQGYDLLVLDAFSSDAIPVHLLTRECFEIYLRHLSRQGVIAVHVSSRYLDLVRVLAATSKELRLPGIWMSLPATELAALPSTWVILSRDPARLRHEAFQGAGAPLESVERPARLWTDEHQSLFEVLAWRGRR